MSAKCSFGFVIAKLWEFVSCAPVGVTSAEVRGALCVITVSACRPVLHYGLFSMNRPALCAEAKFISSVISVRHQNIYY